MIYLRYNVQSLVSSGVYIVLGFLQQQRSSVISSPTDTPVKRPGCLEADDRVDHRGDVDACTTGDDRQNHSILFTVVAKRKGKEQQTCYCSCHLEPESKIAMEVISRSDMYFINPRRNEPVTAEVQYIHMNTKQIQM